MANQIKIFGGKQYKLKSTHKRKSEADNAIYAWRREGHYARIAKVGNEYAVYARWHVKW